MPSRLGAVEVSAVDADMLFGDAAETLRTGVESVFLDAIDAGTVAAVMSDRAFHELGWMSARAARGHAVDHDALRSTITAEYLPRIPVAVVPELPPASGPEARGGAEHSTAWMPDASDIKDPKDVPHGQLARLVLASVVFSHDKDLRKPGYAPRFRRDFDERLGHLETITAQRTFEDGTGFALAGLGEHAIGPWRGADGLEAGGHLVLQRARCFVEQEDQVDRALARGHPREASKKRSVTG